MAALAANCWSENAAASRTTNPSRTPKSGYTSSYKTPGLACCFWGFGGSTLREHRRADAARLRLPTANQRGQFGFGPQPEGAIGGGREQPCRQRPGLTVREAGRQRGKEAVAKMQWQRGSGKGAVAKRQWHRSRRKFAKETVHSG